MVVITDATNKVIAWGNSASIVDANKESGLIKVDVDSGFYYLGNSNRGEFVFHTVESVPDSLSTIFKYTSEGGFKSEVDQ